MVILMTFHSTLYEIKVFVFNSGLRMKQEQIKWTIAR